MVKVQPAQVFQNLFFFRIPLMFLRGLLRLFRIFGRKKRHLFFGQIDRFGLDIFGILGNIPP